MSPDEAIRNALEWHLASLADPIPTAWEGRPVPANFDDTQPHQKPFLLRGKNQSRNIREKTTLHSGIFQVNLCYPSEIGVEARAGALQQHFEGKVLEADGVRVRIRGKPDIAAPVTYVPYVVPVSIRYESFTTT